MLDPADDIDHVTANPGNEDIRANANVTRTMLTALAAALVLLVSVPAAGAAPAATAKATNSCWLDVINDWLDNNRVDKVYPTACYTQAIQTLNQYPDVQNYSSAADDIHRALLAAIHDRGSGGSSGGGTGGGTGGSSGGGSGGGTSGTGTGSGQTPISSIFNSGKPSSAQSVPLPLLVLGGLAGLLLLSAGGTWLIRRAQARRAGRPPTPAVEKHL
ncbi:MAG: hypothetical protein QOK22_1486 [Gaiellaceae bacterium]|nr:hypothetical protein [Gaiellaceae bacterium]